MKRLSSFLICAAFTFYPAATAQPQLTVNLGAAAQFTVLAGTTVTNTGFTTIKGDLGVWPGTAVIGFGPGAVNGAIHLGDTAAQLAQGALTTAYNDAAGRTAINIVNVAGDLGGQTLTPGLYKCTSSLAITGSVTLAGKGIYIFQIASALTVNSGSGVVLSGGAQASDIFWQVGSSAAMGTTSHMKGTILALASISSATGGSLDGRTLARNGAVTFDSNVVTVSQNPFGVFDTPADNATGLAGAVAVSGWALSDVMVNRVTIWRDPVGPEPIQSNGYVYIGDALFVPGARPDVAVAYPGNPGANRAGWGYLMLTNMLPNSSGPQGNGTFKLHAFAIDATGNVVNLGTKTITVDNLSSTKPFGTLDTPAPGETISGMYRNSGWALTPQPAVIAIDGSTIWVNIDGVNIAHPLYGMFRSDIASALFSYANSNTSGGEYSLDTTRYSNAMHTISWNVYDSLSHGDGIGSRYIQIQNSTPMTGTNPVQGVEAGRAFQLRQARLQGPATPAAGYPAFRQGYDPDAALTPIRQGGEGLLESIELRELDRLEIHLPGGPQWTAVLRVGDESHALPVGSTFDAEGGIFYWQLGPAFLGEYLLEFRADDGTVLPVPVRVGSRTSPAAGQ